MKHSLPLHLSAAALAFSAIAAQGAIVSLSPGGRFGTNSGNAVLVTSYEDFSGNGNATMTTTHVIGGQDIDGDSMNDEIKVVIQVAADTSSNAGAVVSQTNGRFGVDLAGGGSNQLNNAGEAATISITSITATFTNPSSSLAGTTYSLIDLSMADFGSGDSYTIDGGAAQTNDTFTFAANTTSADVAYDAGTFRVRSLNYQINLDVVPEPSTTMLFGLSALAFLTRRSR